MEDTQPKSIRIEPIALNHRTNRVPADVMHIAANVREADQHEAEVAGFNFATDTLRLMAGSPYVFIVYLRDKPVFVFGVALIMKGVGQVWGFGTKDTWRTLPAITHFIKTFLWPFLADVMRLRRVQVHIPARSDHAFNWLTQHIGFKVECLCHQLSANGEDQWQLAITNEKQEHVSNSTGTGTPQCPASEIIGADTV